MFDPTKCEAVSMKEAKAQEAQNPVNEISRATSIAFVTLAEGGQIDDVTATENASQFSPWVYPATYKAGNIRRHNGELYRCIQDHTSQADWTRHRRFPVGKDRRPTVEWPDWSQPVGAQDAYDTGAKVSP